MTELAISDAIAAYTTKVADILSAFKSDVSRESSKKGASFASAKSGLTGLRDQAVEEVLQTFVSRFGKRNGCSLYPIRCRLPRWTGSRSK